MNNMRPQQSQCFAGYRKQCFPKNVFNSLFDILKCPIIRHTRGIHLLCNMCSCNLPHDHHEKKSTASDEWIFLPKPVKLAPAAWSKLQKSSFHFCRFIQLQNTLPSICSHLQKFRDLKTENKTEMSLYYIIPCIPSQMPPPLQIQTSRIH